MIGLFSKGKYSLTNYIDVNNIDKIFDRIKNNNDKICNYVTNLYFEYYNIIHENNTQNINVELKQKYKKNIIEINDDIKKINNCNLIISPNHSDTYFLLKHLIEAKNKNILVICFDMHSDTYDYNEQLWKGNVFSKLIKEKLIKGIIVYGVPNKKIKNTYKDIPEEIKNNPNIVTTSKKEEELIKLLANKTTDKQFQGLYLITTTSCNLNCDYCFYRNEISESLVKRSNMSFATARDALDKFKKIVSNNKINKDYWQQITFYGGEPSLNKELLKEAIPYAKKIFDDNYTSIVINTNLTIYDKELFDIYKNNNVEVQVSIDGIREQHDLHRKMYNGDGSYDKVIENIFRLKKMGVNVVPMITASDANIENFSEILCEIIKKLEIKDFGVNILITDSYQIGNKYPLKLAKEMIKAYKKVGNKVFDYSFVEIYEGILGLSKKITRNSCGSGRKITIFPNGNVFSCQALEKHPKNYMGNLNDDFISNQNWNYWRKRNKFLNKKCLNCEVIGSCGGGCAMGAYNKYKNIYDVDYNQCEYTKALFKELHNKK